MLEVDVRRFPRLLGDAARPSRRAGRVVRSGARSRWPKSAVGTSGGDGPSSTSPLPARRWRSSRAWSLRRTTKRDGTRTRASCCRLLRPRRWPPASWSTTRCEVAYYQEHLKAVHRAIEAGVPVKGYCACRSLFEQFRMEPGLLQTLRHLPRRLRHPAAHLEKKRPVLQLGDHQPRRGARGVAPASNHAERKGEPEGRSPTL